MADGTTVWKLDLDILGLTEKALKAKGSVESIGEAKNLEGLIKGLGSASLAVGAVGAAVLALKGTMEAVFEAENIKAINQQFELLTHNAGIATDTLKEGLIEASKGLIDDTDLMKMANKALIEMGSSAKDIPQLMELARKASAAFGTDLSENFEKLSHAVSIGSTRQLRQMGIIIDSQKAMQQYASAIGTTVDSLSQAEKQQAILNAVLDKGGKAFKGVSGDAKEAQNTYQQIKVIISEIGEILTLAFDRIAGPAVKNFLKNLKGWMGEAKQYFVAEFGSGAEQAAAKTEQLRSKIVSLKAELIDLEQLKIQGRDFNPGFTNSRMQVIQKQLSSLTAQYDELEKKKTSAGGGEKEPSGGTVTGPAPDYEKRKSAELKFNQDMIALRQQRLQSEMATVDTLSNYERMHQEQITLLHQETENKIDQIKLDKRQGRIASEQEAQAMIAQIKEQEIAKVREIEDQKRREQDATLNRYAEHSKSVIDGVGRGFESGAQKQRLAMADFGKRGEQIFDSFGKHATDAFLKVGEGAMNVGQAMKSIFLNVIADRAQAEGAMMMLSGIFPPNPVQIAAGAALIALAGYLRSQAGGGKGSGGGVSGGAASGGSSGGTEAVGFGTRTDEAGPVRQQEAPKKSVTVQVQGHYFETEQTKQRMLEMIRESTDATDFKYVQVGQK